MGIYQHGSDIIKFAFWKSQVVTICRLLWRKEKQSQSNFIGDYFRHKIMKATTKRVIIGTKKNVHHNKYSKVINNGIWKHLDISGRLIHLKKIH